MGWHDKEDEADALKDGLFDASDDDSYIEEDDSYIEENDFNIYDEPKDDIETDKLEKGIEDDQ